MTLDLVVGIFVWLLGLCVGSFLNVVVYRLPAGLSLSDPPRSFCPRCRHSIAWYDNIPLLSWLVLRARCRQCGGSISVQYPLVEAITGLTFVLVYYLLFVAGARAGVGPLEHVRDWPLLLAWLVLAAALVACAAMDIVSYMLDVRVAHVAIGAGIVLQAAWPRAALLTEHAAHPLAAGATVAFLASLLMLWRTVWRADEEEPGPDLHVEHGVPNSAESPAALLGARVGLVVIVGLAVWLLAEMAWRDDRCRDVTRLALPARGEPYGLAPRDNRRDLAVPLALAAIFAAIVLVGGQKRPADLEVQAAIEQEQSEARGTVLRELAWLAPIVAAGVASYLAAAYWPAVARAWRAVVGWSPGGFCPPGGMAVAMLGALIGAASGWVLRIVFTLVFGREAMGIGDIYLLGAAGAAAGGDIALLGLLLAVGIALAAFIIGLLLKRTVIIPFGPWLAIGFVAALWLNQPAADTARAYYKDLGSAWAERPDICAIAGAVMLVGAVLAVVLARLVRRLVEPTPP